jgi:predicted PurR-regulated permease PerM
MTVALLILGVDYAPLFGFAIGIANLVPIFGAIVAGVLVALFSAVTDGFWSGVLVGVIILAIQQIDANVLQPRIVGKGVGVQPLYTLIAITVGGGLFGFWGVILGVPIAASLQLILTDIMDEHERKLAAATASATDQCSAESSEDNDTTPADEEQNDNNK